jgi:hypothetical protein
MRRLLSAFVLMIGVAGCSEPYTLTVTSIPTPPPPAFRGVLREISAFHGGGPRTYFVTIPDAGTLVARLTWHDERPAGTRLELQMGGQRSASEGEPLVVGQIPVLGGQSYEVTVNLVAEDYWEGGSAQFDLVLSLE